MKYGILASSYQTATASYILDDYTGASYAYGLRKLASGYSGNCIKVKRSSDNTEQDIGFDGDDLDVASLTSFVGSSIGIITKWYDQSGNSRDLDSYYTSALYLPTITDITGAVYTSGTNGLPAIRFDSTISNHIKTTSTYSFNISVNSSGETFFHVVFETVSGFDTGVLGGQGSNTGSSRTILGISADRWYIDAGNSGTRRLLTTNTVGSGYEGTHIIAAGIGTSSTNYLYKNGSEVANGSVSGTVPTDSRVIVIGSFTNTTPTVTSPFNGLIQEFIVWNSNQYSNVTGIYNNANNYFNL